MKIVIRCTRTSNKIPLSVLKQFDPVIEKCEKCQHDIWVTAQSRNIRAGVVKSGTLTVCKECVAILTEEDLKSGNTVLHSNADATEIRVLRLIDK